ncbi:hypothetical protein [Ornithinimicrobium pratense]|uniref:DUF2871 domain-containing protein n=1 Tax=Ornithinimicrobium pratense TaxID=2593973 RepID=A0A5J6V3I9_9MICO|nr:hypothetical protein [Ornithinimicrobium pratense]QFG68510.1 hypothetical protein FY030_07085 [Ornithinimicrobium pratense]
MSISPVSRRIAGLLLLTVVAVQFGGYFLTRVVSGQEQLTDFQTGFARAGHAHAGVLIILSLVCLLLVDAIEPRGAAAYVARLAVPAAAVLMSAGFFLSSMGSGLDEPNGWIVVLWLGAASLTVGVLTLGVALLRAGPTPSSSPAERARTR